jgi:hypothetical protein
MCLSNLASGSWDEEDGAEYYDGITKSDLLNHQLMMLQVFAEIVQWSNAVTKSYQKQALEK